MAINSKDKGKRGERMAAAFFREHGYSDARRSQQYAGINNDADIVGVPGIHAEIKFRDKLNVYDALDQSRREAKDGEMPMVMWKKTNCRWIVIQDAEDWIQLYREWEAGQFLTETSWISVSERLPPAKKNVFVCYEDKDSKVRQIVTGCYIDKFMISVREVGLDIFMDEASCDYNEADDCHYIPKGWYETPTNGNKHYGIWEIVNADVLAWMELPEVYKGK